MKRLVPPFACRLLVALTALAAVAVTTPARAVPPLSITGSGVVSPGLNATADSQWFAFDGTATDPVTGTTYACSFTGSGTAGGFQILYGTMQGSCGPFVYPTCAVRLDPTTFSIACTTTAGSLAASYTDMFPTTRFTASGVLA